MALEIFLLPFCMIQEIATQILHSKNTVYINRIN